MYSLTSLQEIISQGNSVSFSSVNLALLVECCHGFGSYWVVNYLVAQAEPGRPRGPGGRGCWWRGCGEWWCGGRECCWGDMVEEGDIEDQCGAISANTPSCFDCGRLFSSWQGVNIHVRTCSWIDVILDLWIKFSWWLREAIKKSASVWFFFQFCLDPPPPLFFLNPSRNFFQNLILYKLKFLKVFGLWLSPQI